MGLARVKTGKHRTQRQEKNPDVQDKTLQQRTQRPHGIPGQTNKKPNTELVNTVG